ncbi:hypothetical protein BDZ89DRAFT_1045652 [Hymenopellis radicata]|nr:hypothetical protein BDZ89DRAFT_1045652 [Hymenopellis radicata]
MLVASSQLLSCPKLTIKLSQVSQSDYVHSGKLESSAGILVKRGHPRQARASSSSAGILVKRGHPRQAAGILVKRGISSSAGILIKPVGLWSSCVVVWVGLFSVLVAVGCASRVCESLREGVQVVVEGMRHDVREYGGTRTSRIRTLDRNKNQQTRDAYSSFLQSLWGVALLDANDVDDDKLAHKVLLKVGLTLHGPAVEYASQGFVNHVTKLLQDVAAPMSV